MNVYHLLISEKLEKYRDKITDEDVQQLSSDEKKLKIAQGKSSQIGLIDEIKLAYSLIKDYCSGAYKDVSWKMIASLTAAVAYLISPLDAIPDIIPGIGLLDDAAMIALVFWMFSKELECYRTWKNSPKRQLSDNFVDTFCNPPNSK